MREDIRTVRFVGMQGTDELFRCIENKKVYIRRCYEEPYAEWLTTTSWSGGYEPDCHIRSGVSFRLVDRKGNEVFTEKVEQIPGYWYPYAVRKGPFYTDCLRDLSQKVAVMTTTGCTARSNMRNPRKLQRLRYLASG